ncbi:MAG: hypothetical protein WC346_18450 [Methanogenium sp.]
MNTIEIINEINKKINNLKNSLNDLAATWVKEGKKLTEVERTMFTIASEAVDTMNDYRMKGSHAFNINDEVEVNLTAAGLSIFKKKLNIINHPDTNTLITEMWDFMNIFGDSMYNGQVQLFVDNKIIIRRRK